MRSLKQKQDGFITMIVCIAVIVVAVIYFAWKQVVAAQS
jgi:hypothetical protein